MVERQGTQFDATAWTGQPDDRVDSYETPAVFPWRRGWRATSFLKLVLASLVFGWLLLLVAGGWKSTLRTLILNQPLPDWEQFKGLLVISLALGLYAWFFARMLMQTRRARRLAGDKTGVASPALAISENGVRFAGDSVWSLRWSEIKSVRPRLPASAFVNDLFRFWSQPRIVEIVASDRPQTSFAIPTMAIDVDAIRLLLTLERKIWGGSPSAPPAAANLWNDSGRISGRPFNQ